MTIRDTIAIYEIAVKNMPSYRDDPKSWYRSKEFLRDISDKNSKIEIYSPTGICNGSGSDRYKSVTYLTKMERRAVKAGITVYVDSNTCYQGINFKIVTVYKNKFYHRQATKNIDVNTTEKLN